MSRKHRVVVIDDERLIRDGLATYIDWQALDAEVVELCADGAEGLRAIERHAPCIALTDVSMPNVDGIELLKAVRRRALDCEVIIISAYADFQYAQEALKYNAFDYILKPLEPEPLFTCVRRCIEHMDARKRPAGGGQEFSRETADEWLRSALLAMPAAEEVLMNKLRAAGAREERLCLLIGVGPFPGNAAVGGALCACAVSERVYVALFACEEDARAALSGLNEPGSARVAATAGGLSRSFGRACCALWEGFCPPEEREGEEAPAQALDAAAALDGAREALGRICREQDFNLLRAFNRVEDYVSTFYRQMEESYESPLPNVPPLSGCLDELARANNLYDLLVSAQEQMRRLVNAFCVGPSYNTYTRKAVQLIRERYAENLTLRAVAAELNISPAYFSTQFKENTGYTFSSFLYRYRMNIAQQLLRAGDLRIYEIAAAVGYPDVVQFSKRFKQFYGRSPRDMRRKP